MGVLKGREMTSKLMMFVVVVLLSVVSFVSAAVVSTDTFDSTDGQSQFDIDFVTISGDTNPTSGDGIVDGDYRMGMYEITNDQFAKFASNGDVRWTGADIPSNMVSWFEVARFVNYLNTSTGNAAAYKLTWNVLDVWEDGDDGYDAGSGNFGESYSASL
jgi:hypothetical protein